MSHLYRPSPNAEPLLTALLFLLCARRNSYFLVILPRGLFEDAWKGQCIGFASRIYFVYLVFLDYFKFFQKFDSMEASIFKYFENFLIFNIPCYQIQFNFKTCLKEIILKLLLIITMEREFKSSSYFTCSPPKEFVVCLPLCLQSSRFESRSGLCNRRNVGCRLSQFL